MEIPGKTKQNSKDYTGNLKLCIISVNDNIGNKELLMTIVKISDGEYETKIRGNHMRAVFERGRWTVYTQNATTRAYNNGFAFSKDFRSLEEVEGNYKGFKGLCMLANSETAGRAN